jgi:hypothetical protein
MFEEFNVLLVEMGERAEFGIRLTGLEAVSLYSEEMVAEGECVGEMVGQVGVLVAEFDVHEVICRHLLACRNRVTCISVVSQTLKPKIERFRRWDAHLPTPRVITHLQ